MRIHRDKIWGKNAPRNAWKQILLMFWAIVNLSVPPPHPGHASHLCTVCTVQLYMQPGVGEGPSWSNVWKGVREGSSWVARFVLVQVRPPPPQDLGRRWVLRKDEPATQTSRCRQYIHRIIADSCWGNFSCPYTLHQANVYGRYRVITFHFSKLNHVRYQRNVG